MKGVLCNTKISLRVLAAVSGVMFISLLVTPPKIAGIFLILWVLSVFWNVKIILFSNGYTVSKFVNRVEDRIEEAKKEKNYFMRLVYSIALPMMTAGLTMVVLILVAFFTIL